MDKNTEYDCSGKKILQILHYKMCFFSFPGSPTASLSEPGGVPVFMPSSG